MKKILFGLLTVGSLLGVGFGLKSMPTVVYAEEETTSVEEECKVVIEKSEHGTVSSDIEEGSVGEIVTLEVKNDFCYVVESVTVNGTALVESETTKGKYTFALVKGENKVSAKFVIDEKTFGVFTKMVEEAQSKDWKNLFSTENVLTIVKWVLDGGVLVAFATYFIKDKKLSKKVEDKVESTIKEIIPESTKQTVVTTVEKVVTPIVSNLESEMSDLLKAMGVLAKCTALAQENTAESRKAIIDELAGLQLGDSTTLAEVKAYIEKTIKDALNAKEETLKAIEEIKQANQKIIEEEHSEEKDKEKDENFDSTYDGTTI